MKTYALWGACSIIFLSQWAAAFGPVKEGDETGFYFRDTRECLATETELSAAKDLFVSPNGSDENDGQSPKRSFASVQKALCIASPGTTIHIYPGVYHESAFLAYYGAMDARITVQGIIRKNQMPVFDGQKRKTMGIALVHCQNITIQNIIFQNYTDEGVFVAQSRNIVMRNNRFLQNGFDSVEPDHQKEGFGIQVTDCDDILIENNIVRGNGPKPEYRTKSILGTGIDTYNTRRLIIRGNVSSGNIGGGILVEDGKNVLVEKNTIQNNDLDASADGWWDAGIWIDGGHDIWYGTTSFDTTKGPAYRSVTPTFSITKAKPKAGGIKSRKIS